MSILLMKVVMVVCEMSSLIWAQCIQICFDIREGLSYRRNNLNDKFSVIHRDIKSGHIILDDVWKVSDLDTQILPCENMPILRHQQVYRMPSVARVVRGAYASFGSCDLLFAERLVLFGLDLEGLSYLQNNMTDKLNVIHRDIKSAWSRTTRSRRSTPG
nr:protein kinase-like domain, phloem protein 2-like protein [Tanacetum cinerariifolium]